MNTLVSVTDALVHLFVASVVLVLVARGGMTLFGPGPRLRAEIWFGLLGGLGLAFTVMVAGGTVSPSLVALGPGQELSALRDGAAWRIPFPPVALVPLAGVWALVTGLLGTTLLRDALRTWRRVRALRRDDLPPPLELVEVWCGLGAGRGDIRITERVGTPTLLGVHRPILALPRDHLGGLSRQDWTAILAHEAEHVRWCDDLKGLVARLSLVAIGWNPVAWWIWRAYGAEREMACDGAAVRVSGLDPVDYGHLLIGLTRQALGRPTIEIGLAGGLGLPGRIAALIADGRIAAPRGPVLAPALTFLALTAVATASTPRLALGPMGAGLFLSGRCEIALSVAERAVPGSGRIEFGVSGPGAVPVPCSTSPGQRWARRVPAPVGDDGGTAPR